MDADILRTVLSVTLEGLLSVLPREIRESILSRGTLAILTAPSKEQRELEVTAVMAEIEAEIQKLGGDHA